MCVWRGGGGIDFWWMVGVLFPLNMWKRPPGMQGYKVSTHLLMWQEQEMEVSSSLARPEGMSFDTSVVAELKMFGFHPQNSLKWFC